MTIAPLHAFCDLVRDVREAGALRRMAPIYNYSIPAVEASGTGTVEEEGDIGSARILLRGDEVLVSRLNPRKGRVVLVAPHSSLPVCCSPEFVALRARTADRRFIAYAVASEVNRQRLDSMVESATRSHQRVRPEVVLRLPVLACDLPTQALKAEFLDRETARIDELLHRLDRLPGLLREFLMAERHAVMGAAPTRVPILLVARLARGGSISGRVAPSVSDAIPFVRVSDMSVHGDHREVATSVEWVSARIAGDQGKVIHPPGGVLFPRVGMAMRGNPRRLLAVRAAIDDNLLVLSSAVVPPAFLYHWMCTVDLYSVANPGAVPTISESDIARLRIPLVDVERATCAATRLDHLEHAAVRAEEALETGRALLREYGQALITEAVTGHIDVARTSERQMEERLAAASEGVRL